MPSRAFALLSHLKVYCWLFLPSRQNRACALPCLRLRQPPPPQLFSRNARQQRFDIKNRRRIQHIDAPNMQLATLAPKQLNDGQPNRIRPPRRSRRKHPMRPIVRRRRPKQLEPMRAVELPKHDKMREALNISKPRLKLRQDRKHTVGFVLRPKPLRNLACVFVRTTHKSNRPRGEHRKSPTSCTSADYSRPDHRLP